MVEDKHPKIAFYNPFMSDMAWGVGSFRAEEYCRALSRFGVTGIVASPFVRTRRMLSDGFVTVPLPSNPLQCLKMFLKVVRRGEYDLVQERPFSRGFVRNGYGLAASIDRHVPLVTELHNIGAPISYVRRLPIHVLSLWHSSLILAYTDVGRGTLFGSSQKKTVTVPNGYSKELVDSVLASHNGRFELERVTGGRKAIGFFGGLSPAKGVDLLLDVARGLRGREDVCFVFAGDGILVERISEAARAPGSNVVYLGILNRYDSLSCMSQCESTFAVYDSLQSAVGNPVKVVESLAVGVPVIVNEQMAMPHELRSHCLMITEKSTKAVRDAIVDIVDTGRRRTIPYEIESLSIESVCERLILPAYKKILESHSP